MSRFNFNPLSAIGVPVALVFSIGASAQAISVDRQIEASAMSTYNFQTYLKNDSIKIVSSDGVVHLTGTVADEYHKALAQDTVSEIPGVKSVDNQLTLVGVQPPTNSDGWISMRVKMVLAFHDNVQATGTTVHTQNGIVTLSGTVNSEAQKQLTTEYAKDVEGVTAVRNDMVVAVPLPAAPQTLGEKFDDASITAQVKTSLLFHKSTHALATKVVTNSGVVTLKGEARNAAERDLVTKLTENINGVKRVSNQMTLLGS